MNKNATDFVNLLSLEPRDIKDYPTHHDNDFELYDGFMFNADGNASDRFYTYLQKNGFKVTVYNAYQVVGFCKTRLISLSYCEGDICLSIFKDIDCFNRGRASSAKFYAEN